MAAPCVRGDGFILDHAGTLKTENGSHSLWLLEAELCILETLRAGPGACPHRHFQHWVGGRALIFPFDLSESLCSWPLCIVNLCQSLKRRVFSLSFLYLYFFVIECILDLFLENLPPLQYTEVKLHMKNRKKKFKDCNLEILFRLQPCRLLYRFQTQDCKLNSDSDFQPVHFPVCTIISNSKPWAGGSP